MLRNTSINFQNDYFLSIIPLWCSCFYLTLLLILVRSPAKPTFFFLFFPFADSFFSFFIRDAVLLRISWCVVYISAFSFFHYGSKLVANVIYGETDQYVDPARENNAQTCLTS